MSATTPQPGGPGLAVAPACAWSVAEQRELLVSLWYPAAPTDGRRVRAFFDQHLRGRPQALLDQPSSRYPEVTFCSPD